MAPAVSEFLVLFELCTILDKSALDINAENGFIANGGDSLGAVALSAACKDHGLSLPRDKILKSQSLRDLFSAVSCAADEETARLKGFLSSKLAVGIGGGSKASSVSLDTSPSSRLDLTPIDQPLLSETPSYTESVAKGEWIDTPDTSLSTPDLGPLTEMQLLFIRGSLRQPGTNVIVYTETYRTDDIQTLKEAWRQVIAAEPIFNQDFPRHPALDSCAQAGFNWVDSATQETTEERHAADLGIGSFFHVTPVDHISASEPALSKVTWTVHHSLIDGYSASVLLDKVLRVANGETPLPPGPSFSRFAAELDLFRKASWELGSAYWASKKDDLSNAQHELLLPPASPDDRYVGSSTVTMDISSIAQDIQSRAKSVGVTPAAFFNAAWALTLAAYADSDLVSFGAVLCGRNAPIKGASDVIGPLLNTLPFAVHVDKSKTTDGFLQSTFNELVELEDYEWTTPENGFHRSFETALSVQLEVPNLGARRIRPLRQETRQEHEVPLGIRIEPSREVSFDYHVHRFSSEHVQRLGETYRRALLLLLESDRTVDDISRHLLPESHVELLHQFGNCSPSTLTASIKDDLVTLFERRAREIPGNNAIEKGSESMSYAEMDRIASRLAFRLSKHIDPGEVVCVYSDRSMLWLCAIFGILKAGGVYCSLDPAVPDQVRSRIFGLSGSKTFITAEECDLKMVPEGCPLSFSVRSTIDSPDSQALEHRRAPNPQSPAYVCFTSGSTGTPKGVLCAHAGLVAFQSSLDVRLFAAPGRRVAHVMSVAFDGSIHELFSALTYGATLVLPFGSDPFGHLHTVDSVILTPSLARVLHPGEFERLKWVYLVGEPVPQAVCDRWASVKQLYNMYGPTEGTCGATIKRLLPKQPVTIGVPNPTTRIYILTSDKNLAPPGVIGELYLGGVQVARGYLDLPEQTQQRFLPDTLWPLGGGELIYKTGDRGYWTEDGEVCLLGRRDREIKLRGYRLDMGDLEIRIARAYPSLQAVAVTRHCSDRLVAMVQPQNVDVVSLRAALQKALPHYAMPHVIVTVDKLPVTGAGKIDYKAVSQATPTQPESKTPCESDELATPAEFAVAGAYRSALQLSDDVEITAFSNFVSLGGHSLRQLELLRYLSANLKVRLPLKTVLACRTVRELAKAVDEAGVDLPPSFGQDQGKLPESEERATPIEAEWVTKYRTSAGSSSFNVCFSCVFDSDVVDQGKLIEAWNLVLRRHQLLSCHYVHRDPDEVVRVSSGSVAQVQTPCSFDLRAEANRPFNLELEHPVRVFVTDGRLTIVLSHIVADYTALALLMREASDAYNGGPLPIAPRRYSEANVWYETPSQESLDFWASYLQDLPSNPHPFGPQPARVDYSGTSALSIIDADIVSRLLQYSTSTKTTLQQLATACIALCLDRSPSGTDIVLGVPHINRETADDLDTFGLFLQPLPVRISYPPSAPNSDNHDNPNAAGFIDAVKSASQAALAHAIPWHQLLGHVGVEPEYPNHPLFEVMVTMHDFRRGSSGLEMGAGGFESTFTWAEGAKFKLLCEFTALENGRMLLRIEYDDGVVPPEEVGRIQKAVPVVMGLLAGGAGHGEIKRRLRELKGGMEGGRVLDGDMLFGKSFRDIL
ncbi:Nonribosomal peptide synthetase 10 [Madurella mycetomatis]|uniref:Nonribosomal peptide synthetase 10 n=1 Tax=Madurella mycetomatis TaxID=100816 RepID=A0A175WI51_9PEZI|nr:Nonribosomal peptide synthetase 10 [Madurella mycetomatis]